MVIVVEHEPSNSLDDSERGFATVNPTTGEVVQEYPFLASDLVISVVEQAHAAFLSWRDLPVGRARSGCASRGGPHVGTSRGIR